ncbi:MAG: two-component system, LytT family, response regulator [Bacteroidetes bacterium]|nr:MAG: two-component system, LytT family, response regulator [Bacteroidota bacterium]
MATAIIIDDEEHAAENLAMTLNKVVPGLKIEGTAYNALKGLELVNRFRPDIVFLDIHMPGSDGLELAPMVKETGAKIVFVTAYENYAVSALRIGAQDYLVKPVSEADLKACLDRVLSSEKTPAQHTHAESSKPSGGILRIPVKDGFLFIRREDLVRVEGSGSYSNLFLDNGTKHLVTKSIGQLEEMLGDDKRFFRCHNSHIVQVPKIERFISQDGLYVQMNDGSKAEVSRKNKEELLQLIDK